MLCPSCKKPITRQGDFCPFCGAYVPSSTSATSIRREDVSGDAAGVSEHLRLAVRKAHEISTTVSNTARDITGGNTNTAYRNPQARATPSQSTGRQPIGTVIVNNPSKQNGTRTQPTSVEAREQYYSGNTGTRYNSGDAQEEIYSGSARTQGTVGGRRPAAGAAKPQPSVNARKQKMFLIIFCLSLFMPFLLVVLSALNEVYVSNERQQEVINSYFVENFEIISASIRQEENELYLNEIALDFIMPIYDSDGLEYFKPPFGRLDCDVQYETEGENPKFGTVSGYFNETSLVIDASYFAFDETIFLRAIILGDEPRDEVFGTYSLNECSTVYISRESPCNGFSISEEGIVTGNDLPSTAEYEGGFYGIEEQTAVATEATVGVEVKIG